MTALRLATQTPTWAEAGDRVEVLRALARDWSRRRTAAAHGISRPVLHAATSRAEFIAARGWQQILKAMAVRPTLRLHSDRVAAWRIFRPQGQVEVPASGSENPWAGMGGGMVAIGALIVGRVRGKLAVTEKTWSLAFADRALIQLVHHDIAINPFAVMEAAHDALLAAPASLAPEMLEAGAWTLPGGPGAFAIQFRGVLLDDTDTALLATASDWISAGNLSPQQRLQAARISGPDAGRNLGQRALLPPLMRPAAPPFTLPGETAPVCNIPV